MQLFVIALVLGIFLHDGYFERGDAADVQLSLGMLAISLLPKIAVAILFYAQCSYTRRKLGTRTGNVLMRWLDRSSSVYRWVVLMLYAQDLARITPLSMIGLDTGPQIDLLGAIRNTIQSIFGMQIVLIDEVLVMLPSILMMVFAWWCFYPIDRRLRESSMMGDIDEGKPVYPIWTRGQFLISQLRHQLALMLVPMLLLIAILDVLQFPQIAATLTQWNLPFEVEGAVLTIAVGGVFLFAPLMIRMIWDTTPLPDGELRQMLLGMCTRHRIGVRQLLLWRTFGGMINAAVIGAIAPLRYILLSDALLDNMPKPHVEAVMAHEIAHVRRHHMFWLILAAIVLIEGPNKLLFFVAQGIGGLWGEPLDQQVLEIAGAVVTMVFWVFSFGWVSRRFERQADTFAVQHLSQTLATSDPAEQTQQTQAVQAEATHEHDIQRVHPQAVEQMVGALQQVASLNHIPTDKKSWRHGSIRWRQKYLHTLVGRPLDALSIDRVVRRINLYSALVAVLLLAAYLFSYLRSL